MASPDTTKIAVLGLGYVGCVTAACFANMGYRVTGIDKDEHKVNGIRSRTAPFYEPGFEELLQRTLATAREGSLITAWGKKTGDRIIADVFVYSPPGVMFAR